MADRLISNVSDTARWVAVHRAWETARPDALFSDPLAARLAGEQGKAIAALAPRATRNGWPMVVRTRLIDDLIMSSLRDNCDCVVNLAAGLDTRPYRLQLPPSLNWIEADLEGMIEEKNKLLDGETPVCRLRRERVDLTDATQRADFLDGVEQTAQGSRHHRRSSDLSRRRGGPVDRSGSRIPPFYQLVDSRHRFAGNLAHDAAGDGQPFLRGAPEVRACLWFP